MSVEDLATRLVHAATEAGVFLASAESLTGGSLGAALTAVPGSSAAYLGGAITYARDLKVSLLGVDADLVATRGVINAETAEQMALGTLELTAANVAMSTTGVAGPSGQDGHPVGEVWIGVAWRELDGDGVQTRQLTLSGSRDEIRVQTVEAVLSAALDVVERAR